MTGKNVLVVVQCGEVRLIGEVEERQGLTVEQKLREHYSLELKDVGVLAIVRGAQPGPLGVGVKNIKIVGIANIDFAFEPMKEVEVEQYSFGYTERQLDEKGAAQIRESYEKYKRREPNQVEYSRMDNLLP